MGPSRYAHTRPSRRPKPSLTLLVALKYHLVNDRSCDSRVYEYLFPSYILMPPHASSPLGIRLASSSTSSTPAPPSSVSPETPPTTEPIPSLEEMTALRTAYRLPASSLTRLNALLKEFEGTHNFWNYTVGRDFKDRAAGRYMLKIEVRLVSPRLDRRGERMLMDGWKAREPQVYDGLEWISVLFHGQSFMLHQVRIPSALFLVFPFVVWLVQCHTNLCSVLHPDR